MTREDALAQLTGPGAPFEIGEVCVRGQPQRVYRRAPPSLRALFEATAVHAARTALVYEDEQWSYAQLHARVAALARLLAGEYGVARGERVAIGMRNTPEWPLAFWATQCLGAVAVPLNAFWTGPELAHALADSGARVALVDGERPERLAPLLGQLRGLRCLAARARGALPAEVQRLEDALASLPADSALPAVEIEPDDDSTILYTSGTTGRPKGAVHSQRNHVHNVYNGAIRLALDALVRGPQPAPPGSAAQIVALQTFPFFHIAGLGLLYAHGYAGAKIVLLHKWDARRALELIERERVTWVAGVPTVVRSLLDAPERGRFDLSSLCALGSGGAPVPPDLVRRIGTDLESVAPLNGYGLTETTSSVVSNAGDDYLAAPDSVGRPSPTTGLRVVAADGRDAEAGAVGEVWLSGPQIVRGYWNDPEASGEAFRDGWFRSGDLGYCDARGNLHIVDRIKDMVIRGGENVYCAEVEARLFEHPAVADVAVIGLPHAALGEEVAAVIEPRAGALPDAEAIRAFAAQRLAAYKVPSRIFFQSAPLPRNAVGKVLKRQLRDEFAAR